jgi:putative FmdB family regulatory protein
MPIYEYRCSDCGHQQDFIQKVSDPQLTKCTACGKETFSKMLTAAGFQLKGSGWYATDFKNKPSPASPATGAKPAAASGGEGKSEGKTEAKTEAKSTGGKDSSAPSGSTGGTPAS